MGRFAASQKMGSMGLGKMGTSPHCSIVFSSCPTIFSPLFVPLLEVVRTISIIILCSPSSPGFLHRPPPPHFPPFSPFPPISSVQCQGHGTPTAVGWSTGGGWEPNTRCCWCLTDEVEGDGQRSAVDGRQLACYHRTGCAFRNELFPPLVPSHSGNIVSVGESGTLGTAPPPGITALGICCVYMCEPTPKKQKIGPTNVHLQGPSEAQETKNQPIKNKQRNAQITTSTATITPTGPANAPPAQPGWRLAFCLPRARISAFDWERRGGSSEGGLT